MEVQEAMKERWKEQLEYEQKVRDFVWRTLGGHQDDPVIEATTARVLRALRPERARTALDLAMAIRLQPRREDAYWAAQIEAYADATRGEEPTRAALRGALPAEPPAETLEVMRQGALAAMESSNVMAGVYHALRAYLLGEDA